MSEQERYGQEPYEAREPYAPYPPGHGTPADGQGQDPYAAQQGYGTHGQGHGTGGYAEGTWDPGTQAAYGTGGAPGAYESYDTGQQAAYDPAHHPQGHTAQQYTTAPQHPGYDTGSWPAQQQPAHHDPYGHGTQQPPAAHPAPAQQPFDPFGTGHTPYGEQYAPQNPQYAPETEQYTPGNGTHADGGQHQGAGIQQQGAGNQHQGAGNGTYADAGQHQGAGIQHHGGGNQQQGAGNQQYAEASAGTATAGAPGHDAGDEASEPEEFAFVEEEDEQAEDVIDWLKFSESRTERRDERRRRGRTRTVAIALAAVLVVGGGGTYAWHAGLIPGLNTGPAATPLSAQKRDVIVVHLREVGNNESASLLLVRNETTGTGTALLLPNSLLVSDDGGNPVPLAHSVVDAGAAPTRDGLDTLLGANIQGTWRLDTPFLEVLVNAVGGIEADTDATIKQSGRALVTAGRNQSLNGRAAVAYATYRAPGEPASAQLARFGQVLRAVLVQIPSSGPAAAKIMEEVGSVPDPSLSNAQLGATLAALSDLAKSGRYSTKALQVRPNGTLSAGTTEDVVKQILGGTVKNSDASGVPVISVSDATSEQHAAGTAQAQIIDSGNSYIDGGKQAPRATSQVLYPTAARKAAAQEIAKTLGLPAGDVAQGKGAANADITVVLGADYRPPAASTG